ncbi:NADH dehydrogenase 1 alpha subcomplex assembly factor 3 [Podospora fimiseda]|uniref:NADH dehydrogenase 1 alpha subcomplex assembly factor 3 n=1 Tax=Podospora fimiseda TaxID=252190 RepID=A0AAN7BMK8_9PEZI|nr:NADH dehydrogenase 1 alpha subcomplex assembly factor 3 [Podospora fimiseda]
MATPLNLSRLVLRRITSTSSRTTKIPTTSSLLLRPFSTSPKIQTPKKPIADITPRNQPPPRPSDPATAPTQPPTTDLDSLDILSNTPIPSTSVDICHSDGFTLNSGITISSGAGALLISGEAFEWRPNQYLNKKGQFEIPEEAFGVLSVVWPRPDLLILGLGTEIRPIGPKTREIISKLGIRIEVCDTRNAASQYNLLATERGVDNVAAALIPLGWKGSPV